MYTTILADTNAKPGLDAAQPAANGSLPEVPAPLKVDPDEDGIGSDDSADTLRYLVSSKSREIHVVKLRGL